MAPPLTFQELILQNRFLHIYSLEGRDRLIEAAQKVVYQDREFLFEEGDSADGVDLVLSGAVEIMKLTEQKKVILTTIQAGDYFGEIAVLDGHGRSTHARARGETVLAKIPTATMLEVLTNESSAVCIALFDKVLKNLRHTNNMLINEMGRKEKMHLVGEMASSLIHDFRNPLSGIIMAADYLRMVHPDDQTSHWCDLIIQQSERMTEMARELLEFSRGESTLSTERTSLKTFFDTCSRLLGDILQERGVEITYSYQDCELEIDSMRMLRVFQNLMTNAADAMHEQHDRQLELISECQDGKVIFNIKDNGPGIPESIQSHMFEPFTTHGKKGGTGLGMAIVLKIVQAHGGTITFETAPGEGTCFIIVIPQFHSQGAELGASEEKTAPTPVATVTSVIAPHRNLAAPIMSSPYPDPMAPQ